MSGAAAWIAELTCCVLFVDALLSGKAFDPIIEDWVEQFEEDEDQALGELVVFLLRVSAPTSW